MQTLLQNYWPHIAFLFTFVAAASAAVHAAMNKTDVRAAIGWVGIILFSPLLGAFFYLIAGVNRIRHDQISQQRDKSPHSQTTLNDPPVTDITPYSGQQFASLQILGNSVSSFPLCDGNDIQLLCSGDETYPAMLKAIEQAQTSIALQSYIFDNDRKGRLIADALVHATRRGVKVRVLIDAIGSKYSRPPIVHLLRRNGVRTALFMTNPLGLRMPYANLRSHRKILIVDGLIGFTGGMNIRAGFTTGLNGEPAARDTHFRVEGPIVQQLTAVFLQDWEFTTRENLDAQTWYSQGQAARTCAKEPDQQKQPLAVEPTAEPERVQHTVPARCIRSGPDRSILSTHHMLQGAFAVAQHNIRIQSPYFLPDITLLGAINTAARRGIQVDIVIPGSNNLRLVNYAMTAQLDQIIRNGCRVWRAQGPFNHSKLITIDGSWSYVGSSNMDPRSLRLNFELDVEIYSRTMARELEQRIDAEIRDSERVTLEMLAAMPFRKRLRNKIIWLASPYL